MNDRWIKEYQLALSTARAAGKLLYDNASKDKTVIREQGRDIKIDSDFAAHNLICGALKEQSSFPVLSEEDEAEKSTLDDQPIWIVDPLDGTMNFSRDLPLSAVSIALWQANEPILGVVYDFIHEELFSGIVNQQAWLNDQLIRVSNQKSCTHAVLATGFPTHSLVDEISQRHLYNRVQKFKKTRMIGSAALSLAWTAAGRIDAYYEAGIMMWDVAAGLAIVRAAGGSLDVRDYTGDRPLQKVITAAASVELMEALNNGS